VFGTGEVVNVPVGEALLGRIVDPLGRPLDGKGPIETAIRLPIERPAPSIIERDLVTEPVQTGIVAMDTLFALGRGQRELIVGDHSTGKTTLGHRRADCAARQRHDLHLCRCGAEDLKRAPRHRRAAGAGGLRALHRTGGQLGFRARAAMDRALCRA
jgi:vacuolar-type H+-ATPase subunit B/Vma2